MALREVRSIMPEAETPDLRLRLPSQRNREIEAMISNIVSNRQDLDAQDLDAMDAEALTRFLRGLPRRELERLHRSLDLQR
jgi:hypothetical protein